MAAIGGCTDPKKASESSDSAESAIPAIGGLDAVPSRANVIIGLDVPQMAASPLVARTLSRRLPVYDQLGNMVEACEIDPSVDLESVLIALMPGKAGQESLLIAKGKLTEALIAPCMGRYMATSGGQVESSVLDGRRIYHPSSAANDPGVWFAFGTQDTLLVASGRGVLADALSNGPKANSPDEPIAPLLQRANTKAASIWVAMLPSKEMAAGLAAATQGAISGPTALVAKADLSTGLDLHVELAFSTESDAKELILLASSQREAMALTLQDRGLGRLLTSIEFATTGHWASLSWKLDEKGLSELVGVNFQGLGSTIDNVEPNDENPAP